MSEASLDFWEVVFHVYIFVVFFHLLSQMDCVGQVSVPRKKKKLYLSTQKVLKYQTTEKGETNKVTLDKLIIYFSIYPQKCHNIHSFIVSYSYIHS